jgi:hypothetical protein
MFNKFGECAKLAVSLLQNGEIEIPISAWKKATLVTFPNSSSLREKGCPKDAFLAICETGKIKNVAVGNYTKSIKNKNYALKIMELLKNNSELANNKQKLWQIVRGDSNISHNSQIDVVMAMLDKA